MKRDKKYEDMLSKFLSKDKGKIQKKADGGDIMAQEALNYTGQGASFGASVGSVIPGVGTLVGAGVGAGVGLLGGLTKGYIDSRDAEKAKSDANLNYNNMSKLMRINSPKGIQLAEGGYVNGGGTGKSDSIQANVKPESFVIPVDTPYPTEAKMLMKALGTNKEANLNSGTQPVKLSKGELLIDARQRQDAEKLLTGLGIQGGLSAMAPNAKLGNKKADGGFAFEDSTAYDPEEYNQWRKSKGSDYFKGKKESDVLSDYQMSLESNNPITGETKSSTPLQDSLGEQLMAGLNPDKNAKPLNISTNNASMTTPSTGTKSNKTNNTSGDNNPSLGTIAALSQGVLGAANLASMKAEPNREISPELKSRYVEAFQEAQYGMSNAQKQAISQDIEMNRRTSLDKLVKSGGIRSSGDALARAMAVGQQANRANLDLNVKDSQLKAQKQARVDSLGARLAGEEAAVYGAGEHKYERDQRASGALLQAGINNIVEIDRLKRLTKDPESLKALMDEIDRRGYSRGTIGKIR